MYLDMEMHDVLKELAAQGFSVTTIGPDGRIEVSKGAQLIVTFRTGDIRALRNALMCAKRAHFVWPPEEANPGQG